MPTPPTSRALAALSILMLVSCIDTVDRGRGDAALIPDGQAGRGGSGGSGGSGGGGSGGTGGMGMAGTGGGGGTGGTAPARDAAARMDAAGRRDSAGRDVGRDTGVRRDGGGADTSAGARIWTQDPAGLTLDSLLQTPEGKARFKSLIRSVKTARSATP
jgi:hypothetical protein